MDAVWATLAANKEVHGTVARPRVSVGTFERKISEEVAGALRVLLASPVLAAREGRKSRMRESTENREQMGDDDVEVAGVGGKKSCSSTSLGSKRVFSPAVAETAKENEVCFLFY